MKKLAIILAVAFAFAAIAGCSGDTTIDTATIGGADNASNSLVTGSGSDQTQVTEPNDTSDSTVTPPSGGDDSQTGDDTSKDPTETPPQLSLTPDTLPAAKTGTAYGAQISVLADNKKSLLSYEWKVNGDLLPKGMKIISPKGEDCSDGCTGSHIALAGTPIYDANYPYHDGCTLVIAATDPTSKATAQGTFHFDISADLSIGPINPGVDGDFSFNGNTPKIELTDYSKDPNVSLADLANDQVNDAANVGALKHPLDIQLKAKGGKSGYTWELKMITGEATMVPDAKDSSKAVLHVTKLYPIQNDPSKDARVPFKVSVTDAAGKMDSLQTDIRVKYPQEMIGAVNLVGGGIRLFFGPNESGAETVDVLAQQIYAVINFGDGLWVGLSNNGTSKSAPDYDYATTPMTKITSVSLSDGRTCGDVFGDMSDCPDDIPSYPYLKLQTLYWEADYNLPHQVDQQIADIVPSMTGYIKGQEWLIWHRRTDVLPHPEVVDGPIGKTTNQSPPSSDSTTCNISDDMKAQGYQCVAGEFGGVCPLKTDEINQGYKCVEGCVYLPEEKQAYDHAIAYMKQCQQEGKEECHVCMSL